MTDADFGRRIPYLVRRVHGALSRRLDATLRAHGLTQAQLSALALLAEHPESALSSAELSRRSGVTPQSMSSAVGGLEERGLVRRAAHPGHGRILDVLVTSAGVELVRTVQARAAASEEADIAGLDALEQEELRRLLRKMMAAMDLYLPRTGGGDDRDGDGGSGR